MGRLGFCVMESNSGRKRERLNGHSGSVVCNRSVKADHRLMC